MKTLLNNAFNCDIDVVFEFIRALTIFFWGGGGLVPSFPLSLLLILPLQASPLHRTVLHKVTDLAADPAAAVIGWRLASGEGVNIQEIILTRKNI